MGGGNYSEDFYRERETVRKAENRPVFHHDHAIKTKQVAASVHANLDPRNVKVRESRDSKEHPNSCAIGVVFDITGSMRKVPEAMQAQLPKLMNLLVSHKFVDDPQILIGAVGDTTCDPGSLQIGQFESSNKIDEDLGRLWIVEGGGGQMRESYQNAMYFFARHTSIDCLEKRNKKGYLFMIGDEMAYDRVDTSEVSKLCNDGLEASIPLETIITELKAKYNVFFIIPTHTMHGSDPAIHRYWSGLLGRDHVIQMTTEASICELIGVTIGLNEGTLTKNKVQDSLKGSNSDVIRAVTASVEHLPAARGHASVVASATVRL